MLQKLLIVLWCSIGFITLSLVMGSAVPIVFVLAVLSLFGLIYGGATLAEKIVIAIFGTQVTERCSTCDGFGAVRDYISRDGLCRQDKVCPCCDGQQSFTYRTKEPRLIELYAHSVRR